MAQPRLGCARDLAQPRLGCARDLAKSRLGGARGLAQPGLSCARDLAQPGVGCARVFVRRRQIQTTFQMTVFNRARARLGCARDFSATRQMNKKRHDRAMFVWHNQGPVAPETGTTKGRLCQGLGTTEAGLCQGLWPPEANKKRLPNKCLYLIRQKQVPVVPETSMPRGKSLKTRHERATFAWHNRLGCA